MTKGQSVIAIIICLGISIGSIVFMNWGFQRYGQLKDNGFEVEASIKRIYQKRTGTVNNKVSYSPFMEYTFEDQNGVLVEGGEFVSNEDKQSLQNADHIMVTYLPDDPTINQSSESLAWTAYSNVFVIIVYVIIGFCILGIIVNIRNLFCS